MISYIEKGIGLHEEIARQGHRLENRDGTWISDNDAAVQAIIDSYDPLPYEKQQAHSAIDEAAGRARARYITVAPGQESTYQLKREQAQAYKNAGYTGAVPALVQAEADATGSTPQQAADNILAVAAQWETLAAQIEKTRRQGKLQVDAVTLANLTDQAAITLALNSIRAAADNAVATLDAI